MTSLLERLPESSVWLMILVKMTALLAVAWAAHWLLLGRNPRWRVMLWRGVMAGLVVLPVLELAMPAVPVKVAPPAPRVVVAQAGPAAATGWITRRPARLPIRAAVNEMPRPEPTWLERAQANPGMLLAIGWGLVAVVLAAKTLVLLARVRRLVKGASPAPQRLTALLERVAREMQCSRHVGLRLTAALVSPFLTRVLRPVILLPERMTAPQRTGELEGVLAHELAHVRGHDLLWLLLARGLSCVLWFHPLTWRLAGSHAQACEEICDAVAAEYVGGAPAYSGMLARVALELMADAPADGGVGMVQAASILRRVRRIKRGIEASAPARRWIIASLAGGGLTLLALGSLKVVYAEQDKGNRAAATRPATAAASQPGTTMEKRLMTSQATVKREGDKVWIDGVKGWSIPEMPSSIHGAQTTIMQALGEKVAYEELLGASGLAFRMQVSKEGMCPSSPHSYCGWQCVRNSNRMIPWQIRVLEAKPDDAAAVAEARKAIMASIDRGIPVQYGSEEDGVIVGYQKGGEEWLCLHPYKGKMGQEVFVEKKWPWGIAIYTQRKDSVPARRDLAVEALRQVVAMAREKEVGIYLLGFAAWEGWIEKLVALDRADEKTRKDSMQGNSWIYFNLIKGRQAAATYLRLVAGEFGDEAAGHLRKAADTYDRMASEVLLSDGKKPEDIAPGPWSLKPGESWQAATRADQVRRLKAALSLEREAIGQIEAALAAEKIDVVTPTTAPVDGKLRTGHGDETEWVALRGTWLIDAADRIVGSSEGNGYLYRVAPHTDDVRITATLRAAGGDEVTVWMCGSPEQTEFAGYTLAVSASGAKLQRQGKDITRTSAARIQPGKDHVLVFERIGATLRGFLDGSADPFIVWMDAQPLRGRGHNTLGFYVCDGTILVANVKVDALGPQRVDAATEAPTPQPAAAAPGQVDMTAPPPPMPTSDARIVVDLAALTADKMRPGDKFVDLVDYSVRQERDERGPYSLIDFRPRPAAPKWTALIVGLPQFELAHGLSSIELEAWSAGAPLRLVVDGTDPQAECFEIGFCPNDTVWKGWKTFQVQTVGPQRGQVSLDREMIPPVRIKWLIVIMRQGQPWQLGLRQLRIHPIQGPVPVRPNTSAPAVTASAAPANSARLDFSSVTLRGNPCSEDSFAKAIQAAAKLLGREVDLGMVRALSVNAFAPSVRPCETCKAWWHIQTQDRAVGLVAGRVGLKIRPLPALDHSATPPMPTEKEAVKAWLLAYFRKPMVPALRKALDGGEIVIAGNEWDYGFHSNPWFGWGIITQALDDGTILGATLSGRHDNPMNYVDNAWVLSAGEVTLTAHQADVEMLRQAVDRVRGNTETERTDVGGVKGSYRFGLEAMDAWIDEMQTVTGFCVACRDSGRGWACALDNGKLMHGGAVFAAGCLRERAASFPAAARPHLEAAAKQYDRIAKLLGPAVTAGDAGHYKTFIGDLAKQKVHAGEVLRPIRDALASAGDEMAAALAVEGVSVRPAKVRAEGSTSQPLTSTSSAKETTMNTVRLEGLKQPKMWMTRPGCLISCAQYLKVSASPAWIYGGTGYAFALNIHKDVCPSGPTAWPSEECDARAANVGLVIKAFGTDKRKPDFQTERKKVWEQTRAAIDTGQPCFGWEMNVPDWYVINGYDGEGNYLFDDFGRAEGRKSWSTLGDSEIGVVLVQAISPAKPADDRTVVREAIRFAIEHSEGKGSRYDWHTGLAGYDTWMTALADEAALKQNKVIGFGMGYNAVCWREARNHAVAFLKEAKQRLADKDLDPLFDEAIGCYSTVAGNLADVAKLYPNHDPAAQAQVMDADRRGKATAHLKSAKEAEVKGLAVLRKIAGQRAMQ